MELIEIKNTLHQLEPYLMVDRVLEIDKEYIVTTKNHTGVEAHVKGHFPGAPVVPGAMLQELCTQSAAILITKFYSPVENYNSQLTKGWALGVLNKVNFAKFLQITKVDSTITAEVKLTDYSDNLFKFSAKVIQDNTLKAKMSFNLVNISDSFLK